MNEDNENNDNENNDDENYDDESNIVIRTENINHYYHRTKVIDNISLAIEEGSFIVLLGPSGSGKTTFMSILGGFIRPSSGKIFINGDEVTDLPAALRPTATVFQDYALFPHMTVEGNVNFGLKMQYVEKRKMVEKSKEILSLVGLSKLSKSKIHQLSGGQKQRVALARALVIEPSVILLDEPLGALDLKLRKQMQVELKSIQRRTKTTFVHVTHDQEEAMSIADAIVVMNNGRIEDAGEPKELYLRPKNLFTADFMGESNFISGTIVDKSGKSAIFSTKYREYRVNSDYEKDKEVFLALRPEQIYMTKTHDDMERLGEAKLIESEFLGTHHMCIFSIIDTPLKIKVRLSQKQQPLERTTLWFDTKDLVLLGE